MKKIFKKISVLLMLIGVTFSSLVTDVSASSAQSKLTIKSYSVSGSKTPVKFPTTFHVKKSSGKNGNDYVFCTYYAKKTPSSGIIYRKSSEITSNSMNYILNEAYKNVHDTKSFFIYQTALWILMVDKGKMSGPHATLTSFKHTVNNSSDKDAKKIRRIVAAAKKAHKNDTSAPTIKIETKNISFTLSSDKKNYVSNKIKIKSSTGKYGVSFENAPSGTTYKKDGSYVIVYVPANKINSLSTSFKLKVNNSKNVYRSYYYKPSNSSYQIMAATYKQTKKDSTTTTLKIEKTTSIKVDKKDSTNNNFVSGAKLEVKDSSNKVIESWTTNNKTHTVNNLKAGTYTLSEVMTPNGYNLNSKAITFVVDKNGKVTSDKKEVTTLTIKNAPALKVVKVDAETGMQIKDATLQIKNSKGKVVDSFTTNGKEHIVKSLAQGTYTLEETEAPSGYKLSNSKITFTVDAEGNIKDSNNKNVLTLTVKNTKLEVNISKSDVTTGEELAGAHLVVKDSDNKVVDEWISTNTEHKIKGLKAGTYTLTETIAPDGYELSTETIKFTIDSTGKLTNGDGKEVSKVVMYNKPEKETSVNISKQDITTSEELEGAHLVVKDSNGNIVDEWDSTNEAHKIENMKKGTYTLTETIAPDGYELSTETIKFTIDSTGKLTNGDGKEVSKVVMYNKPEKETSVNISKQDITTSEELEGAHLVVKDSNGNIVDEWDSTNEAHKIENMKKGSYTLTETIAPDGYILSTETIEFTIDSKGNLTDKNGNSISKVIMYNEKEITTNVNISKQDITTSKELPGAHLVVKDSNGNIVDEWDSTNEVHKIENMKKGSYTLTETIAPDGYILSTETIEFTIDSKGNLTDKNGNSISKVIMYNEKEITTNVNISKQDITTSKELPGAHLVVKDSNGNIVDEWDSTNEVHKIENMKKGSYTLTETIAPDGYILSTETIRFTIDKKGSLLNKDGEKISKVIMYNAPSPDKYTNISKQDITNGKELPGAHLVVKDSNGNIVDEWDSTNEVHKIKNLKTGNYTLTETIAPDGYKLSTETINFSINENLELTNENGQKIAKVTMYNKPIITKDVNISKQDITTSKELPGAHLVVRSANGNIVDEWDSTNEVHKIKGLGEGTYTLTETIAPDGYELSTETIKFTIDEFGNLTNESGKSVDKIVMYNKPIPKLGNINIVKKDAKTSEIISGAKLVLKDSLGNILDEWTSETTAHTINDLKEGTYTVSEVAAPSGYKLTNINITFTVNSEGKVISSEGNEISVIVVENEKEEIPTKVSVSKQDITNGKEIPGAHLVVKDSEGNIVDEWISSDTPHLITGLKPGTYTLRETIAPNGYILSDETITFTVKSDGSITTVVMYNTPESTPETPITPQENPGEEIEVENTSSTKNIITSLMGIFSLSLGLSFIKNKLVKNEE